MLVLWIVNTSAKVSGCIPAKEAPTEAGAGEQAETKPTKKKNAKAKEGAD